MCSTQRSLSTVRASTPKLESICSLCVCYNGVKSFIHVYHFIAEISLSARCIHLRRRAVPEFRFIPRSIDALQVSGQDFFSLNQSLVPPTTLTDDGLLAGASLSCPDSIFCISGNFLLFQLWANRQTPNSLGEIVVHPVSLPGAPHVHGHTLLLCRILFFISPLLTTLDARFRTTHSSSSFCLLSSEVCIVHDTVFLKNALVVFRCLRCNPTSP